ncbi:MAG: ABC transporter substrate-binding protein [Afipia sp.]|jgi:branched-chain amino acid transport system substrate-binding protein|nr:ABC transporter substrate-binding protein [Afipia sp.]
MLAVRLPLIVLCAAIITSGSAVAQKAYGPGVTDTEIKIGNIMPYSGPASAYGMNGKVQAAYFKKINDYGGINGRKINFISYDDAYSPPKTVEQARKLVESDEVLLIFNPLGTPGNAAIHKYMNAKKVPQIFVGSGASKWNDPKNYPWTMGWIPNFQTEGRILAQYVLKEKPTGKVAIFYQNDDYGKDYLKGFKDGLGEHANIIVIEESYEVSEPTIDTHVVKMKSVGADVLISFTTPKFAAQTIKKAAELNWKPLQIVPSVSSSIGAVIKPAGMDSAQGIISATYAKDATDPQWDDDPGIKEFRALMNEYLPGANLAESSAMVGYNTATSMAEVLRRCGDNLTRENVMKQASNLKNFEQGGLLPGITVSTTPTDFAPIKQLRLMRFEGNRWQLFGDVISIGSVH